MKTALGLEIIMVSQIGAGKLLGISRLWLQRYIKLSHGKNGLDCDVKFAHKLMTFPQHCSNKLQLLNHTLIGYLKNISQYCGKLLADVQSRQAIESQYAAFPNPLEQLIARLLYKKKNT